MGENGNVDYEFTNSLLETKTQHLDDLLKEKLDKTFHKQTSKVSLHDIAKIAAEHSPIDLAYAALYLPSNVRPILYENLPNREAKIKFVLNTDSVTRSTIFRKLSDKELKKLFEKMPTDEAVWTMDDMSERRFRKVINLIDPKQAEKIKAQKKHARNSAGRLMTSDFFTFHMDVTIGQASETIRDNPHIDISKGLFIVNEENKLLGYIPHRNMIVNSPDVPLRRVMRSVSHQVSPAASREEVIDIVERYKISCLPVVDKSDFLIGVVAYEDVVEAIEDLADGTFAKMAGTGEKVSSQDPVLKRFIHRFPWLLVTMLAGFVNVGVMSSFESYEKGILTFVLFFVPLITGMSGNIGIQCSTVLVRSLAIGTFSLRNRKEIIFKEFCSGLFAGFFFGILSGVLTYVLSLLGGNSIGFSPFFVASVVGIGLIGACFAGSFLGVFSPLFFVKIGVDPAIASGPIVTAVNDFLSMTIYFLIAWGISSILFL